MYWPGHEIRTLKLETLRIIPQQVQLGGHYVHRQAMGILLVPHLDVARDVVKSVDDAHQL